ncbi:4-(cytidine 5'-diphospho)-2-C-methyl-D-erythritol kinase [soil metagenome]
MVDRAPAKLNLGLLVGERRADGLHELRSLFCPLVLSDRVVITESDAEGDSVRCSGVEGPNLVSVALDALRARGWESPALRVEIEKRIPVAAGLGGGSADAAAVLRMAAHEFPGAEEVAEAIGADVRSQIDPSFCFVGGAGEQIERLSTPGPFALVLIPDERGLSAGQVYEEFDRSRTGRPEEELEEMGAQLRAIADNGASPLDYLELLVNDLEPAAISLRPETAEALAALDSVGAAKSMVTGSGPTAFGLFEDVVAADRAAAELPPRFANAIVTAPQRLG